MECIKCRVALPPDALYCPACGKKQSVTEKKRVRSRGNGQGTVYQLPNKKWRAVKTVAYVVDDSGKNHRLTCSNSSFSTKKDALAYLPTLLGANRKEAKKITFKALYNKWLPTHLAGRDTLNCYKAAFKYFSSIWFDAATDIDIDDLQECIDACPKGKATKKNMKTVCKLLYKYGVPRGYFPEKLNLSAYLTVKGEDGNGGFALPDDYVEKLKGAVNGIDWANYVYAQCYLGFRPTEFLALDAKDYNREEKAFVGGAKTEAGKNRTVTVSPKIQGIIDRLVENKISGPVFCAADGSQMDVAAYREVFYAVLDALGLENPTYEVDGKQRHTYTPHSCRHTFATMMKRVTADNKDKLELIGHSSEEMLRYYQEVSYDDLRKITDSM